VEGRGNAVVDGKRRKEQERKRKTSCEARRLGDIFGAEF
jgi:hypothetical protein